MTFGGFRDIGVRDEKGMTRLCFKKFQIIGMFHRAINIFFVLYSVYRKLTSHRSPMRYQENEKFFPFEYGTLKSTLNVKS